MNNPEKALTDKLNCGGGNDVAVADRADTVSRHCETVR